MPLDIDKQIKYWNDSGIEDLQAAEILIKQGKVRHGLFFAHLALEKILKAHVCRTTRDLAPRIHNLTNLAERAALQLDDGQRDFLAEMEQYQLEGRYPFRLMTPPSVSEAKQILEKVREVFEWLKNQL